MIQSLKSKAPTRKVTSAALAGAVSILLAGVLRRNGIDLDPGEAQALTVVLSFGTAYVVKD